MKDIQTLIEGMLQPIIMFETLRQTLETIAKDQSLKQELGKDYVPDSERELELPICLDLQNKDNQILCHELRSTKR